jgi:hypothetical protein
MIPTAPRALRGLVIGSLALTAAGLCVRAASPLAFGQSDAATIVRGPYLQETTATSTAILWRTSATTATQAAVLDGGTSVLGGSGTSHIASFVSLTAHSTHTYTIVDTATGSQLAGPFSFTTAPAPGATTPFTVLVFGDSGDGTVAQSNLAKQMATESFDVVLHVGDVMYPGGADANYPSHYFTPYGSFITGHCLFPTLGNHDVEIPSAPGYFDNFLIPSNGPANLLGHEYSIVWGCMKVVVLDDWDYLQTTGPPPGYMAWLESELASNTAPWLVVVLHVPLFSSGAEYTQSEPIKKTLAPVFEQYHVNLVLQGHDHAYERLTPIQTTTVAGAQPVQYMLSGGGGGSLSELPASLPQTVVRKDVSHYVLLQVTPTAINGRAIGLGATVIDDFTFTP